jgi:asparagine synthase (glutamine-hydrolysing)
MCGIVGFPFAEAPDTATPVLKDSLKSLSHRGPDGTGTLIRDGIALGHSRLAIIDLCGGAQPMESADGRHAITFNGEIYNYREIREELKSKGHIFRTHSDTEVILAGYREWGKACVTRLRGMFAFAIADYQKRKLFLARDHLGIKPLLYAQIGERFAFASEFQALRRLPWVDQILEPDLQGIHEFLRFMYIPAPRTGFRQIRKLLPGHCMEVAVDSPRCEPEAYWKLEFAPDYSRSEREWQEVIEDALRESVKAHLVADVAFGAFLSGGLDSTLVVKYMAELLDRPVLTFNIGFNENGYDERPFAREAAATIGTEHFEEVVHIDALGLLPKLVRHYGEPYGDSSAVPTWHVSRLAREHVPMVLTGDGGDEFFAGYTSYRQWMQVLNPSPRQRPLWKAVIRPLLTRLRPDRWPSDRRPQPTLALWLNNVNSLKPKACEALWRPEFRNGIESIPDSMRRAFEGPGGASAITRCRNVDIHHYLPSDILTKVDIAAMMHGLECRTPLTDVRIAELVATIPPELLIRKDGEQCEWRGKQPFRKILSRQFPDTFVNRTKMGFGIPIDEWLFGDQKKSRQIKELLASSASRIAQWLDPKAVLQILSAKRGYPTWNLVFLEEWLRQNRL